MFSFVFCFFLVVVAYAWGESSAKAKYYEKLAEIHRENAVFLEKLVEVHKEFVVEMKDFFKQKNIDLPQFDSSSFDLLEEELNVLNSNIPDPE